MSMHKIFFGTIVFFSLAFLAACGGGGSGSSGATGATGAAGTIAVPSAGTLALAALSTGGDTDRALGSAARTYSLTGMDNESADSRLRYYSYLGVSSTSKDIVATTGTGANGLNFDNP